MRTESCRACACDIVAPAILGGGRDIEDSRKAFDLEKEDVRQSRWASFIAFALIR